ncbi:hypothetical protein C1I92_07030 [Jiangella anatolica]|uniref:PA domain-containing protein n=1 Tax=Jiangella anatolica TaxID=2670374 RepID=A0A2W2CX99_9ACTN|nr:hypothetical protein C1I92_07030 [Jiangella anatolica]
MTTAAAASAGAAIGDVVTLITGDRVQLPPAGQALAPRIQPRRAWPPVSFTSYVEDGDWHVVPSDAAALLASGAVDERLFNVSELAEQGDGDAVSGTPGRTLGAHQEPELYDLTVSMRDRAGRPAAEPASATVVDLVSGRVDFIGPGNPTLRLPPSRYSVTATVPEPSSPTAEWASSLVALPELRLDRDREVVLDARETSRVLTTVDDRRATDGSIIAATVVDIEQDDWPVTTWVGAEPRFSALYAGSVAGVESAAFGFYVRSTLEQPLLELTALDPGLQVPAVWESEPLRLDGEHELPVVYAGAGRPDDLADVEVAGALVVLRLPGEVPWDDVHERIRGIADAGGRAVLLTAPPTGPARSAAAADSVLDDNPFALPTMSGFGSPAQRFADRAQAGPLTASLTSRPASDVRFDLAYPAERSIPADLQVAERRRDLAAMRASYHGGANTGRHYVDARFDAGGYDMELGWDSPVMSPSERLEYFSPGSWTLYARDWLWWGAEQRIELRRRQAEQPIAWNRPVAGPGFGGSRIDGTDRPPVSWADGLLEVEIPLYSDGDGRARLQAPGSIEGIDDGTTRLYRDGLLIGASDLPGLGGFDVPERSGVYRLTVENRRPPDLTPWWPTSTRISADWTFRLDESPAAPPLLAVRYSPRVGLGNVAPGGRRGVSIPLVVERQRGAPAHRLTHVAVDVSYDDGASWRPARVSGAGDRRTLRLDHPGHGFVSLRARIRDAAGNTVEQTIIRAYEVG